MKILITEDCKTSQAILDTILTKQGYEVILAANGQEAYDLLHTDDSPQLVLLDWMMPPGMDGIELCKLLRSEDRTDSLYIILLTAKKSPKDVAKAFEAGADDFISKPYDADELVGRVNAGKRILELQKNKIEREKLQGALEMAGAVCHEINQPLQVVSGLSELLMMELSKDDPNIETIEEIKQSITYIGELTSKLMRISSYNSKDYMGGAGKIVDIDRSSEIND